MLSNALKKHDEKTNNSQQRIAQSELGTGHTAGPRHRSALQSANPGYRNPLKLASDSAINGLKRQDTTCRGLKRTASGLAKAINGSFEDAAGSQNQPIVLDGLPLEYSSVSNVAEPDIFCEDDFDSDIELDIEEPLPQKTLRPSRAPSPKLVKYPVLPSSEQVAGHSMQERRPAMPIEVQGTAAHTGVSPRALKSSAPLPWSSSPPSHMGAKRSAFCLEHLAFDPQRPVAQQDSLSPERAMKKRRIPWLSDNQQPETAADSIADVTITRRNGTTPVTKPNVSSQLKPNYPWNTTASAVKEQTRKHREEAKKMRTHVGDEEYMLKTKSTQARPARVFLSEEQQHVLDLVVEKKKSVFFTGSAGTGKSVLMREIISSLRRKYSREPDRVAVTASTGLAACNVGGVTLHSFAGIGLGKEDVPELVKKIKRNQKNKHRWMRTKVLVVDEVSMVDGNLFDKLEAIARQIRNNARPFGGIQLVITGDFFQLPPVPEGFQREARFAFDAATWSTSVEHTIGLHHVFRQKDPIFANMLNEMREGKLKESSIKAFQKLSRPLNFEDSLDATELFPTRQEVERANAERLAMLQGNTYPFAAKDGGSIVDKAQRDRSLANCMAPETITLKKGAQVMLIKNIDEILVNGSIGRVIGFMDERQFDSYNTNETAFAQSPGGTIQGIETAGGLDDRLRLMEGITTSRKWPLVRFAIADGTWRDLLCQPESWKVELPNGEVQASRSQVPLILAWALSIHKAQGQTLDRVKVDLGKVFEKGQAYVALSRATSMAGLQVLRFDRNKVMAHEKVKAFYSKLARFELAEKNKQRMESIPNDENQ